MWSLTRRTKRISSFRKFRLLPPKDFFASIDPKRTGAQPRHTQSSAQSVWPGRHCKRFFAVAYYKLLAAQPVNKPSLGVSGGPCRWELDMAGRGICSAVLTFVGALSAADAWAADVTPTKVPPSPKIVTRRLKNVLPKRRIVLLLIVRPCRFSPDLASNRHAATPNKPRPQRLLRLAWFGPGGTPGPAARRAA